MHIFKQCMIETYLSSDSAQQCTIEKCLSSNSAQQKQTRLQTVCNRNILVFTTVYNENMYLQTNVQWQYVCFVQWKHVYYQTVYNENILVTTMYKENMSAFNVQIKHPHLLNNVQRTHRLSNNYTTETIFSSLQCTMKTYMSLNNVHAILTIVYCEIINNFQTPVFVSPQDENS